MRELAAKLGISHATVSRALRNDARISPAVRQQVRRAAKKHGYRRDPKLAALMQHMRGAQRRIHQGSLAFISNFSIEQPRQNALLQDLLQPARRRAHELGYKLEPFFSAAPSDASRFVRIFSARGISGVWSFMLGDVDYDLWKWDWNRFAFVHTGSEPRTRTIDVVDAEDRANIRLLFHSLATLGYRRIGVATTHQSEAEALYELSAGRVRFALEKPEHPAFAPCLVKDFDDTGAQHIARWIERHRVDCIVSRWRTIEPLLKKLGLHVPRDIGLAYVTVHGDHEDGDRPSGIDIHTGTMAATAIDTLVAAVEQQRFGLPDTPRQILIPGTWWQGRSTRSGSPRGSPAHAS